MSSDAPLQSKKTTANSSRWIEAGKKTIRAGKKTLKAGKKTFTRSMNILQSVFYQPSPRMTRNYQITTKEGLSYKSMEEFASLYMFTGKILGHGAQGDVLEAQVLAPHDQNRPFVAVKTYDKAKLTEKGLSKALHEPTYLLKLQHLNIVQAFGLFEDDAKVYFVMEKLSGGNLLQALARTKSFTVSDARKVIYTIILALRHCEERGICHRDIKLQNILLRTKELRGDLVDGLRDKNGDGHDQFGITKQFTYLNFCHSVGVNNSKFDIVLADFGLAYQVDSSKRGKNVIAGEVGTIGHMAPEILKSMKYNYKVDVYALGVIFYMLLTGGFQPFVKYREEAQYAHIPDSFTTKVAVITGILEFKPEKAWGNICSEANDLVMQLLENNPENRPNYNQILTHDFFFVEDKDLMHKIDLKQIKMLAAAYERDTKNNK